MPKKSFKETYVTRANLTFFILGIVFLMAFFGFTVWVRADHLRSFDFDTTVRIQNITPIRVDDFFSFLSVIGRFEYTVPALLIVLLIWSKLKPKRLIAVFFVMGFLAFAHVLEIIGKTILEQPGPPNMFLRSHYSNFPGLHVYTQASYPSGHALRIIFLGIVYSFLIFKSKLHILIKSGIYLFLLGTTIAMLYSRVSLGEHWTTDVVGGVLLGIGMALLSLLLLV